MAIIFKKNDHKVINIDDKKILIRYHDENQKKDEDMKNFEGIKIKLKELADETREFYFSLFDQDITKNIFIRNKEQVDTKDIEPEFKEIVKKLYNDTKDLSLIKYAEIYSYYLNQLRDYKSLKMILINNKMNFENWFKVYVELNVDTEIERYFEIAIDDLSTQRNVNIHLSWVDRQKKLFLEFLKFKYSSKFLKYLKKEWKIQKEKFLKNNLSEKPSGPNFNIVDEA